MRLTPIAPRRGVLALPRFFCEVLAVVVVVLLAAAVPGRAGPALERAMDAVFVVKAASAKKTSIRDSLRRLRHAGVAPIGVALTQAKDEHTSYYGYQSYYGYGTESDDEGGGQSAVRGAGKEPRGTSGRTA